MRSGTTSQTTTSVAPQGEAIVAVGLQDFGGAAPNFRSRYVVLSKSLFGRVRGTVGYGTGPDVLQGPFGGVELALHRFVTPVGEYDTQAINAGVRLFPLPEQLEASGLPRPTVDVAWRNGRSVVSRLSPTACRHPAAGGAEVD